MPPSPPNNWLRACTLYVILSLLLSLKQPRNFFNIFKFSLVPKTVKDWNSLPRSAVEIVEDAKSRNYLLSMIL